MSRAIFITLAYCIFLLSLLPNNTSFYYLCETSETLFPISRARHFTQRAFLQQLTFIAADDVLAEPILKENNI